MSMQSQARLRQLSYRAWHRGTREADYLVGGLFDSHHQQWNDEEFAWFERLIDEQDVDILSWALGTSEPPEHIAGPMVEVMRRLDYIRIDN